MGVHGLEPCWEIRVARSYVEHLADARERAAAMVAQAQDIGAMPDVVNPERKNECRESFKRFCEEYFSEAFCLGWSSDHLKAIAKIERAVRNGELFALAMPRGSGKTTLCQTAVLWSSLYGFAQFVVLVAASAERARDLLENIKVWIETNELLCEDFPAVCVPVRALERITHRQKGQKYKGEPTRIEWLSDRVVLPYIDDAPSSGVVIACSGLKGSDIRGQQYARPDGKVVRPSLVLLDDPQTSESAWSVTQSARRVAILSGDVLGMAGPGKKISGLCACTVIRNGDMADEILDRQKHPEWHGERTKLIYKFPEDGKLWARYAEIRSDELINDGDGSIATAFYKEHKEAMDAGAIVAWEDRHNQDELSAIQHAMNLRLRDEQAFFAEYQNEPVTFGEENESIDPEDVVSHINRLNQGVVPLEASYLTAFIDVHDKLLYWVICAFRTDFTGYVVDYGTYPEQPGRMFSLSSAKKIMADMLPSSGQEAYIKAGIDILLDRLLSRSYKRENGDDVWIDKLFIDANWGQTTDLVYSVCRNSPFASRITPTHGRFIGANSKPFSSYKKYPGDIVGVHWRSPAIDRQRGIRHIVFDTNYWKSFVRSRFAVPVGDKASYSMFGTRPAMHKLFAEHMAAEIPVHVDNGSVRIDEWRVKPGKMDNHWFDCLVGSTVAASVCGAHIDEASVKQKPRERMSFADAQSRVKKNR